jgi:hypothetical protein
MILINNSHVAADTYVHFFHVYVIPATRIVKFRLNIHARQLDMHAMSRTFALHVHKAGSIPTRTLRKATL